jgi:hypothetical protein
MEPLLDSTKEMMKSSEEIAKTPCLLEIRSIKKAMFDQKATGAVNMCRS